MLIKKNVSIILFTILIFFSEFIFGFVFADAFSFVSIDKEMIEIRKGPSVNSSVVMEVFKGFPLKILQKQGQWLYVSDFEQDAGWVQSHDVTTCNTVIVSSQQGAKMMSGPSLNSQLKARVERQVILRKLAEERGWVKVIAGEGTSGWIKSSLLWPEVEKHTTYEKTSNMTQMPSKKSNSYAPSGPRWKKPVD